MPLIDIKVPDIGDFKDVAVIEVLVKPGDTVSFLVCAPQPGSPRLGQHPERFNR